MSIIKHVTSQKIVAHDFRYDPRNKGKYRKTYDLGQCLSTWVPQSGVMGSERRKVHNGGRVLLAILNSYVRNEIRVATVIQSLVACGQSIAASTQKLPDSAVQSVSTARLRQSMYQAKL